jgi:hypothetical protein
LLSTKSLLPLLGLVLFGSYSSLSMLLYVSCAVEKKEQVSAASLPLGGGGTMPCVQVSSLLSPY